MKNIIINGDDFGISSGLNKGIVEAFHFGTLTSTTLLANGPSFKDAVDIALSNPGLAVGIHLNLARGIPVLPPQKVRTLLHCNGEFLPLKTFCMNLFLGKIDKAHIEAELRAQIEHVLSKKIDATHLDSHLHLHNIPVVMEIVKKLALHYEINRIRVSRCHRFTNTMIGLKYRLITKFAQNSYKRVLEDSQIITNHYYSNPFEEIKPECFHKDISEFINSIPDGVMDLGIHPGCDYKIIWRGESKYNRKKDFSFLTDPFF